MIVMYRKQQRGNEFEGKWNDSNNMSFVSFPLGRDS